jgi:hypothetical protein
MKLPNLEQYLRALQQPLHQVFSDPELAQGKVETNALGMPRARSGNFALVFRLKTAGKDFAVRCFTRVSKEIAQRYAAISEATRLANHKLGRRLFVAFDYQPAGMRVEGIDVPLLKMDWGAGQTLGSFIANHYKDVGRLQRLRHELHTLCRDLHDLGIAHGDIQLGNVLVDQDGGRLTLIDYDGMFVPRLSALQAAEIGHINFQHPQRRQDFFNARLDDFSFIALDLALRLLEAQPTLYERTYSDEEGVVFRGSDYADPLASQTFGVAARISGLEKPVKQFALICLGPINRIPPAEDFFNGTIAPGVLAYTPATRIDPAAHSDSSAPQKTSAVPAPAPVYIGSFEVVPAANFVRVSRYVGHRIELVGKVVEVRAGKMAFAPSPALRPYIYVDFNALASGNVVRVKILPEVLEAMGYDDDRSILPSPAWIGQWVTVSEVVQPIHYLSHPSFSGGIGEASLVVNSPAQIRRIPPEQAQFRLAGNNQTVKQRLKTRAVSTRLPRNRNQQILENLKKI